MINDERVLPDMNNENFIGHLERYKFILPYVEGKEVFSVACGLGYGEYMLAAEGRAKKVVGVDYSEEAIDYARHHYQSSNLEFKVCDARDLSRFKNDCYDVVVSFETIEHLKEDHAFLRELKKLIKPGGLLFISSPNKASSYRSLISRRPLSWFHVREYHIDEFAALLRQYFSNIELYGQKLILKRSWCNLPRYLWYRFTKKLSKLEKIEHSVKPYPREPGLACCDCLAICYK